MLCIRRNLGSRKSQKAVKIQEHTYKPSTIKEPAKENPEAAKKLFPFMVALTDHEQFTDVTKDCSKARRNFLFAAAPWSTLSFLRGKCVQQHLQGAPSVPAEVASAEITITTNYYYVLLFF